jgi:hypothetical protein
MNLFRRHKKFEEQLHEQLGDMEVKPSTSLWDRIDSGITDDSFESGVQNSLENFEQMPYPETWDKIAAELPEPKVYGRLLKYYIGAGLAVLFSIGVYVGKQYQSQDLPVTQQEQPSTVPANDLDIDQSEQLAIVTPAESNHPAEQPDRTTGKPTSPIISQSEPVLTETNTIPVHAKQGRNNAKSLETSVVADRQNNKPESSTQSDKSVETTFALNVPAKQQPKEDGNPPVQGGGNNRDNDGNPPVKESLPPVSGNNGNKPGAEKQILPPAVIAVATEPVTQSPAPVLEQPREVTTIRTDSAVYAQKVQEYNVQPKEEELSRVSISVVAGAHLSFTTYGAPKEATSLNFDRNIELRKELERPMIDWAGGFLVDYRLNNKWMLSTGIMAVNFNQKFDYSIEKALDPDVKNEAGAPTTNLNDSFVAGNQHSNQIRYTWTEVPLFVNYTMLSKNRWNLDMQAGISYAFINTIEGGMIGYDNKGVLVLRDKESFPQIRNTVFVTAMPQVSYQVGPTVAIGLAPTVKYSVTSIIGNERWIQQHPYFIGLNLCLRKRF